jgi:hypothetical protein
MRLIGCVGRSRSPCPSDSPQRGLTDQDLVSDRRLAHAHQTRSGSVRSAWGPSAWVRVNALSADVSPQAMRYGTWRRPSTSPQREQASRSPAPWCTSRTPTQPKHPAQTSLAGALPGCRSRRRQARQRAGGLVEHPWPACDTQDVQPGTATCTTNNPRPPPPERSSTLADGPGGEGPSGRMAHSVRRPSGRISRSSGGRLSTVTSSRCPAMYEPTAAGAVPSGTRHRCPPGI